MRRFCLPLTAIAVLMTSLASVNAVTIASANFEGRSDTDATTIAAGAGTSISWTRLGGATENLDIVTDSGIGSGNAMRVDVTSQFCGVVGTFAQATLGVGDIISVSFTGRFEATPANNGGAFRFGLTGNNDLDHSFGVQAGTGTGTGFTIARDGGANSDDSPLAGPDTAGLATTGASAYDGIPGSTRFNAEFSILKTATGYALTAVFNGDVFTATSTTGWDTYNRVFFRLGGTADDFLVDNVDISVVPEPSISLLGILGGAFVLLRRRR